MTERIHDDEPDTSNDVVRALLEAECPQWSGLPIDYLQTSGTDNAMWRVRRGGEPDVVVRLPRRRQAAAGVEQETMVLRELDRTTLVSVVKTPRVRHVGHASDVFPHRWSVLEWIEGTDAWTARDDLANRSLLPLAADLGQAVTAIGDITDVEVGGRPDGSRGGRLGALLDRLKRWLDDPEWNAANLIDVDAVRRLAAESLDVVDEPVTLGFVHGDLIPGNLLVDDGRLVAVIDWGGVGWGDTAQDLAPAWALLTGAERAAFREASGADDAAWIRGRAFELEHAVGGILYYTPRRHPLGDVMARTLQHILADPSS